MNKGKLKGALVATIAALALTLVGPVGGVLASLWAYWSGGSTRAVHYSNGTTYIHGSVETSGTYASIYCT